MLLRPFSRSLILALVFIMAAQTACADALPAATAGLSASASRPFVHTERMLDASPPQTGPSVPEWVARALPNGARRTIKVALGDLNSDGVLDIVLGNWEEVSQVLLGRGDGSFEQHSTLPSAVDIALGDVNGDGALDVALGSFILLGRGDGTFPRSVALSDRYSSTRGVALGDLNGDGALDAVLGHAAEPSQVVLGRGDGTFAQPADINDGSRYTMSTVLGDVNGDGVLDIVQGNDGKPSEVLLGHGDGTFAQPLALQGEARRTRSIDLGDLDGDGVLDVVLGNLDQPSEVLLGRGDGTFAQPVVLPNASRTTTSIAVGDLNGDGMLDIVQNNQAWSSEVVLGQGDGTFDQVVELTDGGNFVTGVALGDLNGDGVLDIVQGYAYQPSRVLLGRGYAAFSQPVALSEESRSTYSIGLGDLNGDGVLDIIQGNSGQPSRVKLGRGDGTFAQPVDLADGYYPTNSVAAGDLNGDGVLDIVLGNYWYPSTVLLGRGDGTFAQPVELTDQATNTKSVALGDLNRDGVLDIVLSSSGRIGQVLLGHGDGTFAQPLDMPTGYRTTNSVALGDLNGDGVLDVVLGDDWWLSQVLLGHGDGTFAQPLDLPNGGRTTNSVALGDLNGDGALDIVLGNYERPSQVLLGQGDGSFAQPLELPNGPRRTDSVVVGDLNGDRVLDIVQGNVEQPGEVLLGHGDGTFAQSLSISNGSRTTNSVVVGDLNSDGMLDIVQGNRGQPSEVLLGQRNSHFISLSTTPFKQTECPAVSSISSHRSYLPSVRVLQPEGHVVTPALAGPMIQATPAVTLPYRLTALESDSVVRIKGFYSLDGGGTWRPATPTRTTATCGVQATPQGNDTVFVWDTVADGIFGRYDRVVFRIEAQPHIQHQRNGAVELYHVASSSAVSPSFRLRGTQVRVVDSGGAGVDQARVYRLAADQVRGGQLIPPPTIGNAQWLTDWRGLLKGHSTLTPTDRLVALAAISSTDTYTLYHTSAAPISSGLDLYQIRTSGIQTLTVRPEQPLILFNLRVALEWDARGDTVFRARLEDHLRRASELLFRWSAGQIALGDILVFNNAEHWNDAHLRIYATNRLRPSADQGGITPPGELRRDPERPDVAYTSGQLRMSVSWDRFGDPQAGIGEDWARTLAHELGHYALFLNDNYLGYRDGRLVSLDSCPGPMTDPYRDDYAAFRSATDWLPGCAETLSQIENGRADWTTIKRFYDRPGLRFLLREPVRFAPGENPSLLPLAVTQVRFAPAFDDTGKPPLSTPMVVVSAADGLSLLTRPDLRAVLYQGDRAIDLGVPKGEQLLARGARPNDLVCVYLPGRQRAGCRRLTDSYAGLVLQDMGGWHPDLLVTPETGQALLVTVQNLTPGRSLSAQLYPSDGSALPPVALVPDAAGVYAGTVPVTDALAFEGMVRLWEGEEHGARELVQDIRVGSNPGPILRRGRGAPVLSSDGHALLYALSSLLPTGAYYTMQATDSAPPAPVWATPVSRSYRLTTSAGLDLKGSSLSIGYLSQDVPREQEQGIVMAWWDAAARQWQPLSSEQDTDHREVTASVTQPGIYMLMTRTTIALNRAGWNFGPFYPGATQPVAEAVTTIAGRFTSIYGYDERDIASPWRIYDRTVPQEWSGAVNDLATLTYSDSYWIYATEPVSWFVRGGTSTATTQGLVLLPPPATYYGIAPAVGLTVEALVDGAVCASGLTVNQDIGGMRRAIYVLKVRALGDSDVSCGIPERPIALVFRNGAHEVRRIVTTWDNRQANRLDDAQLYLPLVRR